MARAADAPKLPLALAGGIVNRLGESSIPAGALREAQDVDITAAGRVQTRTGLTATGLAGGHSLWSWPGFSGWLYVSGSSLLHISQGLIASSVATVTASLPMSYCYSNGEVFFSNGLDMGIVRPDGSFRRWGFPAPPKPGLSVGAGGAPAGRYLVAWTAIYGDGEESPPSGASLITLDTDGGIQIDAIPSAPGSTALRVYATDTDSERLFYRQTITLPTLGAVVVGFGSRGAPLQTLHHDAMLPGSPLAAYNRRIYAADGKYLRYSSDYQQSITQRRNFWLPFPAAIRMVGAVTDGLYAGTASAVYWIPGGDPDQAAMIVADQRGALTQPNMPWLPGSIFQAQGIPDDGPVVAWVSVDGALCVGRSGGVVQRISERTLALPRAARVAMAYYDADGVQQLRVSFDGAADNPAAVAAEPVAATYRHGLSEVDVLASLLTTEAGLILTTEAGVSLAVEY